MSGLFGTLNISKSGLFSQQNAIDVTSHNIANANTEGYSRQRVELVTTRPYTTGVSGAGQLGTGVQVDAINRIRDSFLDYHTRVELGVQGEYTARDQFLSQIENIINEPSDTGISSLMSSFYDSWQQLSKKADTSSAKKVVAEQSLALTNELNHTYNELQQLKTDTQSLMKDTVFDLNNLLEQVSQLNQEIIQVKVAGQEPNDLMDRRDLLLDELSSKFGLKIDKNNFHGITVTTEEDPVDPNAEFGGSAPLDASNKSMNIIQSLNPDDECRFSCVTSILDKNNKAGYTGAGAYKVTYYKYGDTSNEDNKVDIYVNIENEDQYNALNESRVLWADNDGNALSVNDSVNGTGDVLGKLDGTGSNTGIVDGTGTAVTGTTATSAISFSNLKLFQPPSGELSGYASVQSDIDEYVDEINKLAKSLAFSVNAIMTQSATYTDDNATTGIYNFFVNATGDNTDEAGINAGNITVNSKLLADNTLIIAGTSSASGESDGNRALAVADLKDVRMLVQGLTDDMDRGEFLTGIFNSDSNLGGLSNITSSASGMTMDTYFKDTVDRIGIQEQEAKRMVKNQATLLAGFQESKDSVSGVSMDEEMANLIQYQHAYQANSKVISTVDELLDVVINGLKK